MTTWTRRLNSLRLSHIQAEGLALTTNVKRFAEGEKRVAGAPRILRNISNDSLANFFTEEARSPDACPSTSTQLADVVPDPHDDDGDVLPVKQRQMYFKHGDRPVAGVQADVGYMNVPGRDMSTLQAQNAPGPGKPLEDVAYV